MDKHSQTNEQIKKTQLKLLYNSISSSQTGMILAGCILIYMIKDLIEREILMLWFLFLLVSVIYRLVIRQIFYSQLNQNSLVLTSARTKFLLGVIISGLVWGSASIFLYPFTSEVHQAYFGLLILGIVATSIGTLSPDKLALFLFMPIILLPLIASVIYGNNIFVLPFTFVIIIFIAISYISGKRLNKNIIENIQLRYESRQMASELQAREKNYRVLFENSEDPMLLVANNKILMANQATVNLYGSNSLEQLLNTPPIKLSPFKQPDRVSSIDKSMTYIQKVKDRGYARFEWVYKKLDGSQRPADVTLTIVPFDGEKAIFCILRDILKIKETEQQLIEAKLKSEQENQSKSQFLANMSHEIRTPMNGVIGTTILLLQHNLSKDQFIRAKTIQNSAESMLSILNSILDFSKIEAGKIDLEHINFELNNFIQEFSSTISHRINAKGLTYVSPPRNQSDLWFKGDSGRIAQILMNLIDNAIKFTRTGTISLTYSINDINNKHVLLQFNVTDTGIGLNQDEQNKLFKRFTQANSSTARKYGGTGLGLSISKELAVLMGGNIGFESKENLGSTFWFTVKLNKVETNDVVQPINPINKDNLHKFKANILIVDDNSTNLAVAKGMLELFYLTIDIAEDGQKAISCLKDKPYDLVFMDCQMPIKNGYQATKEIRSDKTNINNKTPIIAMTANALEGDREICLSSGMSDYITKPIDLEQLQNILTEWVPHSKQVNSSNIKNNKETRQQELQKSKNIHLVGFFNYRIIFNRLSGNKKLILTIAKNFIPDMQNDVNNLIGFIKNKSTQEIITMTHKIKGASATFGCNKLSELMLQIETAEKNNSLLENDKLIKKIEKYSSLTVNAIYKELKNQA